MWEADAAAQPAAAVVVPVAVADALKVTRLSRADAVVKRAVDLVLGVLVVILTAPLMLVAAAAIRLESRGPCLFRQVRLGRNGKPFTIYKLRTMHLQNDDDEHARYVEALQRGAASPAAGLYKLVHDPRSTRIGRLLRVTSIDELPQLFNVIAGSMSLVGPRPSTPQEAALWEPWVRGRLAVKPGMTGLWQVEGRSRLTFEHMVRLDLEYAATPGFWLDLRILARTPLALVRRETA